MPQIADFMDIWACVWTFLATIGQVCGCLVASFRTMASMVERGRALLGRLIDLWGRARPHISNVCEACGTMPGSLVDYVFECQAAIRRLWVAVVPPAGRLFTELWSWLVDCAILVGAIWATVCEAAANVWVVAIVSQVSGFNFFCLLHWLRD